MRTYAEWLREYNAESVLFGYRKVPAFLDSGYFYCPYIPTTQTPVVLDPKSFNQHKGILTRYSDKLLQEGAKFYGRTV
jgi:hypothetical protein